MSCGYCSNLATASVEMCLECEQDHQCCYDTKIHSHHTLISLSEVSDLTLTHKTMECSKHTKKTETVLLIL